MDEAIIPVAIKIEPKMLDTKNIKVEPEQNHSNTVENFEYVQLKSEPGDPQVCIKIEPVEDMEDSPETFDVSGLKVEMENRIIEKKELSIKDDDKEDVDKGDAAGDRGVWQTAYQDFKSQKKPPKIHRNPSKPVMYTCDMCSFKTKYKSYYKHHTRLHTENEPLRCIHCEFQAVNLISLRRHQVVHTSPEDVLKCEVCGFQSKYKNSFMVHQMSHKKLSESEMEKCPICGFLTKNKGNMKNHLATHTPRTDVKKCPECPYRTFKADSMNKHQLKHRSILEVEVFSCDNCNFQSKWSSAYKRHILTHTEGFEYKCELCNYQSKQKYAFNRHMLVHKEKSEVALFSCNECDFQTKRKASLKGHIRTHRDTYLTCDSCSYTSKTKSTMKKHARLHNDILRLEDLSKPKVKRVPLI